MALQITQLFLYALIAVLTQNAVFSRALGISQMMEHLETPAYLVRYGIVVTILAVVSGAAGYGINIGLRQLGVMPIYVRPAVFLLCISFLYIVFHFVNLKFNKAKHEDWEKLVLVAAFNYAVFGAIIFPATQNFSFAQTVGFGLGTGIGLTLATLLIYCGLQRMLYSKIPAVWRGLPIILLYIGLISLALYGLVGHQLPT